MKRFFAILASVAILVAAMFLIDAFFASLGLGLIIVGPLAYIAWAGHRGEPVRLEVVLTIVLFLLVVLLGDRCR